MNFIKIVVLAILLLSMLFPPAIGIGQNQNVENPPKLSLEKSTEQKTTLDPWFSKDKVDHLLVSAFITGLGYYNYRDECRKSHENSLYFGAGISFSLGVLKELRDKNSKRGTASFKDLVADLVGIGLGVLIMKM